MDDKIDEILRIEKENNEMLKFIYSYCKKVSDPKTVDNDNTIDFLMNIVANIVAEKLMDSGIGDSVYDVFKNNQ